MIYPSSAGGETPPRVTRAASAPAQWNLININTAALNFISLSKEAGKNALHFTKLYFFFESAAKLHGIKINLPFRRSAHRRSGEGGGGQPVIFNERGWVKLGSFTGRGGGVGLNWRRIRDRYFYDSPANENGPQQTGANPLPLLHY